MECVGCGEVECVVVVWRGGVCRVWGGGVCW